MWMSPILVSLVLISLQNFSSSQLNITLNASQSPQTLHFLKNQTLLPSKICSSSSASYFNRHYELPIFLSYKSSLIPLLSYQVQIRKLVVKEKLFKSSLSDTKRQDSNILYMLWKGEIKRYTTHPGQNRSMKTEENKRLQSLGSNDGGVGRGNNTTKSCHLLSSC